MAAQDINGVLRVPGQLAKDPTDFSAAFPHGGTAIGSAKSVVVIRSAGEIPIHAEEFGCVVDSLYNGERWVLSAALRTWDDDAIAAILPFTAAGGTSLTRLVKHHHTTSRAGQLSSARSMGLIFSADNPLSHPSLYFPRAIPMLEAQARLSLDLVEEHVFPVIFMAIPPASGAGGNTVQYGKLEDFTI